MVLVKPEIKPWHLEVGLRTTCTSQRKRTAPEAERGTFVHRYGGGRSSHPSKSTRHAATACPQDDEPETTGGPRRQTCFFRQALRAPPGRWQGLQVEGETPWDGIKGLVRSSWGKEGSLGGDAAVSGERTPHGKSPGGSVPGQHPSAPLPAVSLCTSIWGLQADSPILLIPLAPGCPVRTQRGSQEKKNPAP